jgi:hypothetical protein
MRVLLLCAYRALDEGEAPLGLKRDADGKTILDRQIEALLALDLEVTCVLAGNEAEEQLRQSPRLLEADMVFDTAKPLSLMSNLREGALNAPHEACFVLPVEIPVPPREVWDFLRNEYAKAGFNAEKSVLQAEGAPCQHGFPLLFTFHGCQHVQNFKDLNGLVDTRLSYLHLALETKPL